MNCSSSFIPSIILLSIFTGGLSSPAVDIVVVKDSKAGKTISVERPKRMIFPGTKWCGPGDVAMNYEDLGDDVPTDKCCRTHDYCEHKIHSGEEKYGLKNTTPFRVSDCQCDWLFAECLQNNTKMMSEIINGIYKDILLTPCFLLKNGTAEWHQQPAVSMLGFVNKILKGGEVVWKDVKNDSEITWTKFKNGTGTVWAAATNWFLHQ